MEQADNASKDIRKAMELAVEKGNVAPPLDPVRYVPHTLKHDLYRQTRLPVDQCIEIGLALTKALQHLHGNGLVHRDIKPSNIIFIKRAPKLADIGLVASMDATMSLLGTAGFLPPEGPGTPQADIYSLGKVLYEMCMGHDRQEFPKLPADLNEFKDSQRLLELNAVILKACHSNPSERYQSAEEMGGELALLQRGESVKHRRTVQRRWSVAKKAAIGACVVALLLSALPFVKSKAGHTPTAKAARLYELGRWHYSQLTPDSHKKALKYLNEAVRSDPKFIEPYGDLVGVYGWDLIGIATEQERLKAVQPMADKLMAIAPASAECHAALSLCSFVERDWHGAEEQMAKAIQINPKLPIARVMYSFYLTMLGRFDEAHRQAQQAEELEPSARATAIVAAWPFMGERRYDRAVAQLQRVMELDRNFAQGHYFIAECYEAQSNYVAAIEEYKAGDLLTGQDPSRVTRVYSELRQAYKASGEQGYLRKMIELILAEESLPENEKLFNDRDLGGYYARLGEKQKALDEIERHFNEPGGWHRLKFELLYDSVHDEPRFKALLKRAGFGK